MDAVVDTIIHPLDPLSLSEIAEAVAILKDEKALAGTIRFPIIRLEEPAKADLAAFRAGKPLPRAMIPGITLESPKITRELTTAWFATRVDERYRRCMQR